VAYSRGETSKSSGGELADTVRVLVLGSGFAGKGHTSAFRWAGAEVVGMVGRTEAVVRQVAAELGIPYASTDWRDALRRLRPDAVAIATPGGAHAEPIARAIDAGCHVFCDKPLAPTAEQAADLCRRAERARVRTAYAASYCYQPSALHAERLVAAGAVGEPLELELVSHYDLNPLIPFGWSHSLAQGGGRMNNNLTHKLAIATRITGAPIVEATGECRNDLHRAPAAPAGHDFRERERFAPTAAEAERGEWLPVDSDWSYTVMARLGDRGRSISAWFRHSALQPRMDRDHVAVHGGDGALFIEGSYCQGGLFLKKRGGPWEPLELPEEIRKRLPEVEGDTERNWAALAREFVADLTGRGHEPYLTFRDGWIHQQVIDAVRASSGWRRIDGQVPTGAQSAAPGHTALDEPWVGGESDRAHRQGE
jgi:predicted dehydrogenase